MFFSLRVARRAATPLSRPTMVGVFLSAVLLASCSAAGDSVTGPTTPTGPSGAGAAALIDMSVPAVTLTAIGGTENISATIRDATGRTLTAPSVTWTSENPTIADVAGSGVSAAIIARAPGVTRIRASSGNAAAFVDVRVLGVRGITITPSALSLRLGDLQPLRVAFVGDAGASQAVRWATLNPSIATVDASGIVTGVGVGTTTVRVSSAADPTVLATAQITVTPARGIALAPGLDAITLWVGDSRTVPVEVDLDATQVRTLLWSSGNPSVATVNANGAITAVGVGTTIITVTALADPRVKAEVLLTVLPARRVTVSPATLALGVQQQAPLTATVTLEPGLSTAVNWTTSDPSVAAVSASGIVTGFNIGVAVITATSIADPTKSGTSVVTVTSSVRSVTISPSVVSSFVGDEDQLVADVVTDGPISRTVTWRSSNSGVATISATGALFSVAPGTATITAISTVDTTRRATAQVTVLPAPLVGITPTQASIAIGEQRTFSGRVTVAPGLSTAKIWRSSDESVATVNASGMVTGISVGTTSITILSAADTTRSATALLTVVPTVRSVAITPANVSGAVGDQVQLTANVVADGSLSRAVTWRTANALIANVTSTGAVLMTGGGQTSITAISVADTTKRATALINVVAPGVQSISLTPTSATLFPSQTQQLNALVITSGGVPTTASFRSSDPAVASVNGSGLVTAHTVGSAIITALSTADTTRRATAQITVAPAGVQSITLSPTNASLQIGQTQALAAAVVTTGGLPTTVSYRSSAPGVATVNGAGLVTAVSNGSAVITALATADTTRRATATITVAAAIVQSVTVTPTTAALLVGQTQALNAAVVTTGGLPTTVTWRTSAASVATVNASGVVSAVGGGSATITAVATADTMQRATATITVTAPSVNTVTISPTSGSLLIGQTQTFAATVTTTGGLPTTVTFRSSAPAVATVNGAGVATAVSVGVATITAVSTADTTRRASATLTVNPRPVVVAVSPRPVLLSPGDTRQLNASVTGDPGINTAVTWTSSAASIASVNASGLVTAVANGSALVTATSVADPARRDTVTVTVSSTQLATSWASTRLGGALYEEILATVGFGASSAFAVNIVGDVYRWDGSSWSLSTTGAQHGGRFQSVHGSSASNVIAVGTNGIVARFNGASWTTMSSGTTNALNDVWVEGSSAAFAVGGNGTAVRFNGSSWAATNTGSSATLNAVWSTSGTSFAVGGAGEVLRFSGGAWTALTSNTSETLYGVSGTSANDVVAVGSVGTVLRFDGSTWTLVANSVSSGDFYAVDGTSANSGRMYIGGDAGLLQLDGTTLSQVSTPYRPRLVAVSADAIGTVWVGGQRGAVMRLSGGSWSTVNLAPDLLDVWSSSATNAWAVGEFGFIYRWTGSAWSRQTAPTTNTLNAVWGASATDAFAGGENGTMLRFNGSSWTTMSFPSTATVTGLWGSSSSNVYATTSAGQVLRFTGAAWSVVATNATPLWGVFGLASGEVYVTGEGGSLLRFNGSGWTSSSPTGSGTLAGIWGSASSNLVTVGVDASGAAGYAFRFNGSAWSPVSVGTTRLLTSVWGPAQTDVYVTGDLGTILRFNGASWQMMTTGTSDLLWSVTGAPTGTGAAFAVGYNGTMVTGTSPLIRGAAMRAITRGDLEPSAAVSGSRTRAQPLPEGQARRLRKSSARAALIAPVRASVPGARAGVRSR